MLIIPKPGSNKLYYIITLGTIYYYPAGSSPTGRGGMHYSVVDMTLNNGKGDITPGLKNIPLKNHNGVVMDYPHDYNATFNNPIFISQKSRMSTTLHADKDKIWLSIIPDYFMNWQHDRYFYNYLITENGIDNTTDGISPAPTVWSFMDPANYTIYNPYSSVMKISPDGQYLCDVEDVVNLYNYNNQTGAISFDHKIYAADPLGTSSPGVGVEFSPNSQLVYFTDNPYGFIQSKPTSDTNSRPGAKLYQYSITKDLLELIHIYPPPVSSSETNDITHLNAEGSFGIQLGMDNKIYTCAYGALQQYWNYLGVINQPNTVGLGCNFVPTGLQLAPGTRQNGTLPQWVHKVKDKWPKVYDRGVKLFGDITMAASNNVLFNFYSINVQNNVNHNGPLPNQNGYSLIQYNPDGKTTWAKTLSTGTHLFPLKNGDVRMNIYNGPSNFVYFNATTGNASSAPSLVPDDEVLVAETNAGAYITTNEGFVSNNADYRIFIHDPVFGSSSISRRQGIQWFNPSTNKFFISTVISSPDGSGTRVFEVYEIINNTFSLILTTPSLAGSVPSYIDNQDRVYLVQNGQLFQYNYFTNTYTLVSINGFSNNNLQGYEAAHFYTSDKCLVYNTVEQKFYLIDFNLSLAKSVSASNFQWITYGLNGDDLYLTGGINDQTPVTIGQQTIYPIPYSGTMRNAHFITKLSIDHDFSFRQTTSNLTNTQDISGNIGITISPNPAENKINISIKESLPEVQPYYIITIIDQSGFVKKSYRIMSKSSELNTSQLSKGIYYVEITNKRGEKANKSFIKL